MPNKPIDRQTIVITGASSGIGLATARMAAARGARVVLLARSGDVLAKEQERIEAADGHAMHIVADVGKRDAVEAAVTKVVETFGGFDTWINVAGVTIYGKLWDVTQDEHEQLMQTNFWGTVNGSLSALAHLKMYGGTIINVGSVASDVAFPLQGMYCASKHAVQGFTDALRMELMQDGVPVAVTLIKPTSINSPITKRARNMMEQQPSLPPPIYAPEEVAHAILHAAVYPRREIYVGGAGKAISTFRAAAPTLYDILAPAISAFEQRNEGTGAASGTAHEQGKAGHVQGDHPGPVIPKSLYTRATLYPINTAAIAANLTAGVSALFRGGNRRHRP